MNKDTKKKMQEITKKIVKEYKPEKIILFGSYAWGVPHEDSDVDLLIVKNTTRPPRKRIEKIDRLFMRRDIPMDFLVYTPKELREKISLDRNLFLEDIVKNGITLYASN